MASKSAPAFPEAELADATELLQSLLRIDTTNPPGNEAPAVELVANQCRAIGLEPELVGTSSDRPNLAARWSASEDNRKARPLILSCHLDVVPVDEKRWTHPPFSGHNDGTFIWGRGAIDMKGFAAMGLAALTRLRREKIPIHRDIIFVAVSDEESGAEKGSQWLVENRPDLLGNNPEYVINEVGGFTVHQKGRRFYPVQVAEKGMAWVRLTVSGQPGHSSLPATDSAVQKLGLAIDAIAKATLPWHPSEEAKRFINGFASPEGGIARTVAPLLAHPAIGPKLLPLVIPDPSRRGTMEAILRNTANPTCLHSGQSINVIPGAVSVDIDGRLAPGQTAKGLIRELHSVVDPILKGSGEFTILKESPAVSFSTETPLFRKMEETLQQADPGCHVVPSIIPGFTDSKNYARLGAHCYGFYPLQLPGDLDFAALFHGDNERIPIDGFHWGIETLTSLLRDFLTTEAGS